MDSAGIIDFLFSFFGSFFSVLREILGAFIVSAKKTFNQMLIIFRKGGSL